MNAETTHNAMLHAVSIFEMGLFAYASISSFDESVSDRFILR
jgi:hypothetical protein